jgi:short-subunit dehydrogenase
MFSTYSPRSALITGASKGLGKRLAYIYGQRLEELHLVARNTAELMEIKQKIEFSSSCKVWIHTLDLEDLHRVERFSKELPDIDLIINNAGYAVIGTIKNTSHKAYESNLAVNFFAPCLILSQLMKRTVRPKKIINILSTTAIAGRANYSSYSSTKAAFWAFTRSFRRIYGHKTQVLEVIVSTFGELDVSNPARSRILSSDFVASQIEKHERAGHERLVMPLKSKLFLIFECFFPRIFRRVFP